MEFDFVLYLEEECNFLVIRKVREFKVVDLDLLVNVFSELKICISFWEFCLVLG